MRESHSGCRLASGHETGGTLFVGRRCKKVFQFSLLDQARLAPSVTALPPYPSTAPHTVWRAAQLLTVLDGSVKPSHNPFVARPPKPYTSPRRHTSSRASLFQERPLFKSVPSRTVSGTQKTGPNLKCAPSTSRINAPRQCACE